jgi:hypothetical protein
MRYYYRTSSASAEKIVSDGFVDAEGIAQSGDVFRGVWITDRPVEAGESMSFGDSLVAVDVDDPPHCARIDVFEWDEETASFRRWLVPAKLLNLVGSASIVKEDCSRGDYTERSSAICFPPSPLRPSAADDAPERIDEQAYPSSHAGFELVRSGCCRLAATVHKPSVAGMLPSAVRSSAGSASYGILTCMQPPRGSRS